MEKKASKKPVWKKPAPKKQAATKLTPEQVQQARTRAAKAGRPYPNLIDNMAVAREAKAARKPDETV